MAKANRVPAISDASVPSAGRVYDYFLGGNHNFEIDRVAAEAFMKEVPEMPLWCRLIRWFLGAAIRQLVDEGFTKFIDFASGLPTVDHIHEIAPKGTTVVYSDIDPITVAYGEKIIEGQPNLAFVQGDAGNPEAILRLPEVEQLFGSDRKAAIGFNGIAWFLPDDRVQHALSVLYDWASPGSKLIICDSSNDSKTTQRRKSEEFYRKVREPVYIRTKEQLQGLFGKWRLCEPGLKRLEEQLPVDGDRIEKASQIMGGYLVGAILEKG